ncbi:uncharacterized protein LOC133273962 [Pezoporus flaviventris]|uniref:uncharacterized protein LOC133273962 n=1 Tax=Pezoporus flaviventris TaxID=889875 RepID=UPI002AB07276|nr:uncharacterized protein LOC133273962 [Pezoporus flaviventris]
MLPLNNLRVRAPGHGRQDISSCAGTERGTDRFTRLPSAAITLNPLRLLTSEAEGCSLRPGWRIQAVRGVAGTGEDSGKASALPIALLRSLPERAGPSSRRAAASEHRPFRRLPGIGLSTCPGRAEKSKEKLRAPSPGAPLREGLPRAASRPPLESPCRSGVLILTLGGWKPRYPATLPRKAAHPDRPALSAPAGPYPTASMLPAALPHRRLIRQVPPHGEARIFQNEN